MQQAFRRAGGAFLVVITTCGCADSTRPARRTDPIASSGAQSRVVEFDGSTYIEIELWRNSVGEPFGDADFELIRDHLSTIEGLGSIVVKSDRLSDSALEHVGSIPTIHELSISNRRVSMQFAELVGKLPKLRVLMMTGCLVSNEQLRAIAHSASLRELYLGEASVGDSGMHEISRLTRLETLWMNGTDVSTIGSTVAKLVQLRDLNLARTRVRDADVEMLGTVPTLRRMNVSGTLVTRSAVERLRARRPEIEIVY